MKAYCGPKYLRGIKEPCDGSCCFRQEDGTPIGADVKKDEWRRRVCDDGVIVEELT